MASPALPNKVVGTRLDGVEYEPRYAVRVVAFNAAGQIAILYAAKDNYYKLPGGGMEPKEGTEVQNDPEDDAKNLEKYEDCETACHREMKEETGGLIKLHDRGRIATTGTYN
jgi:8-oxo-dGTP diphosphatase